MFTIALINAVVMQKGYYQVDFTHFSPFLGQNMLLLMSLSPTTYRFDIEIDLDGIVNDTAIIIRENIGNQLLS